MSDSTPSGNAPHISEPAISSPKPFGADLKLRSLAPDSQVGDHGIYVQHLEDAVKDRRNRNIALTGRYGSGKSSVLDKFESSTLDKKKKTLRISISTLGPDGEDDLTNRIQKELVKQLVYRVKPGKIQRSRFTRTKPLTRWKAALQALGFAVLFVALLRILGVGPATGAFGINNEPGLLAVLGALMFLAAWALRWALGDRFVTQFSSGGTSIQLTEKPDTYFDKYIDEIMAFFEATRPDYVIFEDLDRFDNPQIFDSLRELNGLVNSSAQLAKKNNQPIRFIYAIKDSLFEQLGADPDPENHRAGKQDGIADGAGEQSVNVPRQAVAKSSGPSNTPDLPRVDPDRTPVAKRDAAVAELERANRTKFFDVVIPVVPFLTHANARDYLARAIAELGLPAKYSISRGLQDTVARHLNDMRLLINIRNEFVVFAQRLLWIKNPTPGMTANDLFALVAYKNFHLADFERIPQRESSLDDLEKRRQEIVDASISHLQDERRELVRENEVRSRQDETARRMGERLSAVFGPSSDPLHVVQVNDAMIEPSEIHERSFWKQLAGAGKLEAQSRSGYRLVFNHEQRLALFPEAKDPTQWEDPNEADLERLRSAKDAEIAALRGADFAFLSQKSTYTAGGVSFDASIDSLLTSDLARSLIRRGYIGRYYAEHAAVFRGSFVGVDVANFFRNAIYPNEMVVNAKFTSREAVRNLLEQAPSDFTSSRSVFNIAVINHLLLNEPVKTQEVVAFIASEPNEDARSFLQQYLNVTGSQQRKLVGLLAASPWPGLFDFLALDTSAPDTKTRIIFLDAALLEAVDVDSYALGEGACRLIVEHHSRFTAFTEDRSLDEAKTAHGLLERADLVVPRLSVLGRHLKGLVVESDRYVLDAANLRTATDLVDDDGITLDHLEANQRVWCRCLDNVEAYLDVVEGDAVTKYAIETPAILAEALTYLVDGTDYESLKARSLLDLTSPIASLPNITLAPTSTWESIASASLMVPSVANLHAYFEQNGPDQAIADVLAAAGPESLEGLDGAEASTIHEVMIWILNSSEYLGPTQRVALAMKLDAALKPDSLNITDIIPMPDDLFAELLRAKLVEDTATVFAYFLAAGWDAVSGACEVSAELKGFLTPRLVKGHVLELLEDTAVPFEVKRKVIYDLNGYAGSADQDVLRAALEVARMYEVPLPFDQVARATANARQEDILWHLAHGEDPAPTAVSAYLATLAVLGDEFAPFGNGTNAEVDVPNNDLTSLVVDRLSRVGAARRVAGTNSYRLKLVLT